MYTDVWWYTYINSAWYIKETLGMWGRRAGDWMGKEEGQRNGEGCITMVWKSAILNDLRSNFYPDSPKSYVAKRRSLG